MNNWTRETHLTSAEGKRLLHLNRKLGQKVALLEKQLQIYEKVRCFYSNDDYWFMDDYGDIYFSAASANDAGNGDNFGTGGECARQSKLEIDELQDLINKVDCSDETSWLKTLKAQDGLLMGIRKNDL